MFFTLYTPAFATIYAPTAPGQAVFTTQGAAPRVDGASGALTQHVPLDIPPGRNGLQPDLSLDYNSQNTAQDSIVGYGWSLSIPYIQRMNKTGTQDLYNADANFLSSFDGELAVSGSVVVSTSTSGLASTTPLQVLVIAGGGGGAGRRVNNVGGTGGGGAGGYEYELALEIERTSYTITVGSGGSGGGFESAGNNGGSSSFGSLITATGGGGGGSASVNGKNGASGGGACGAGSAGNGTLGEGNNGGGATYYGGGGGGGGATGVGGAGDGSGNAGAGGAGYTSSISGSSITYAHGGQGGPYGSNTPSSGTANTGSGGEGTGGFASVNNGGNGGSGVVIIRYPTTEAAYYSCGGSTTTSGGDTICTFNSSGTFTVSSSTPLQITENTTPIYGARVDDGSDRQYTYATSTNTWTMYDKSGIRYLFGTSTQSQQSATTSPSNVYKWMLEEVRDTNDNYIRYTYTKDGGQIYPYQIIYTGHGDSDGVAVVTFTISIRPDSVVDYQAGFKVQTDYRISQITAAFDGTNVRQYALSYTAGNNGYRSLLSDVQETGWSGGSSTTLPPMTFAYQSTTTPFVSQGGTRIAGPGWIVADANGDGKNDISVFYQNIYTGAIEGGVAADGSASGTSVTPPTYWAGQTQGDDSHPGGERGVRYVDVNADGKADIVQGLYDYPTGSSSSTLAVNTYATSTGYAWTSTSTPSTIPTFAEYGRAGSGMLTTGLFADVNGTGLPAFLQRVDGVYSGKAYLADGSAWEAGTTTVFAPAKSLPYTTPTPTNSQLIDINGDHLADWIYSDEDNTYVLLNNGSGWESTPAPEWTIATSTLYKSPSAGTTYYDRGIRFVDINGDGLPDMVHSYTAPLPYTWSFAPDPEMESYDEAFLNTGSGWATTTAYSLPTIILAEAPGGSWIGTFHHDEYANWNGNGQQYQDVLSTITQPKGGSTAVTYDYTTTSGDNPELPYSLLVVSKTVDTDGQGGSEEVNHSYSGGLQYLPAGNVSDRKFAGFASTTESRADRKVVTYYNQNNGASSATGEQNDGYAQINHPYRIDVLTPAGTLVQKTLQRWDPYTHGDSTFIGLGRKVVFDYASDGTHRDTATDYTYATTTNDLLEAYDYGEVGANADGTFTNLVGDEQVTTLTYARNEGVNLSVPTRKIVGGVITTVTEAATSSITVAASGGGGAGENWGDYYSGGGGGGGGAYSGSNLTITTGSYAVIVGQGGSTNGQSGGDSSFGNTATLLAKGGAAGASKAGGQGGQASAGVGDTKYSGGNGGASTYSGYTYGGSGGGGAGDASDGGNGHCSASLGGSCSTAPGTGGTNGGGNGSGSGGGAQVNGGGGAGQGGNYTGAQAGARGTVIIEYPTGTITATGGTETTDGGNTVHTFTSNGTFSVSHLLTTTSVITATTTDEKYLYDNLAFGEVSNGNQTQVQSLIATSTAYASSTKVYDTYGLVASSTDRNGNVTTYSYDSYHLYPATTTDALSHATAHTYDYASGKVKTTTDPNGAVMSTTYDGVGRVTTIEQSDIDTPSSLVTKTTYQYTDSTTTPSSIHKTDYLSSATSTHSYTYYDGLGRTLQERASSDESGIYAVIDTLYDAAGSIASKSLPYFSSGTGNTTATTTAALYTHYTYDPLGRVLTTANAVGTTTNAYSKWTTTTTDPNGNDTTRIRDTYNNLATVIEHVGSAYATTTYAYDPAHNLTELTDAAGNVRHFTYDGLGRRLTAEDLHAPADGTYGTWLYTYDPQGNLTSQTDPNGQTVDRTYDALSRLLTEDYTGATTTEATYTYDSCEYGIGRVCTASSTAALITYTYDILGHTTVATSTISGEPFTTSYTYDRQGNITSVTNPDGSTAAYTFNTAGLINSVGSVATLSDYLPTGKPGTILFGSGASTTYAYDPAALYRLARILTLGAATTTEATSTALRVLIVGAGGAGADATSGTGGGGGGAGEVVSTSTFKPASGTYTITVGTGGTGVGGSSSFGALLEASGGAYGSGSDGGASGNGYDGGVGITQDAAGGGGGASEVGETSLSSGYGGAGGSGVQDDITGASLYYGGGGAGGADGTSGTNGGDGVVIIRYPTAEAGSYTCDGGSATTTASDTLCIFTTSGSFTVATSTFATSTHSLKLQDLTYTYDANGNILTRTDESEQSSGQSATYTYDELNRLASAIATSSNPSPYNRAYTYDVLGNLLTRTDTSTGYSAPVTFDNAASVNMAGGTSISQSYTTGSGDDRLMLVAVASNFSGASSLVSSMTYNGDALTKLVTVPYNTMASSTNAVDLWYRIAPASGAHNLVITYSTSTPSFAYNVATYAGVSQASFPDQSTTGAQDSGTSLALSLCSSPSCSMGAWTVLAGASAGTLTAGTGATARAGSGTSYLLADSAAAVSGAYTMAATVSTSTPAAGIMTALAAAHPSYATTTAYSYAGTGYANPDAVTALWDGTATTTYAYDNNGNRTAAGSDTYTYDYANRLTQSVVGGITTTYGYDTSGNRVYQTTGTTTTYYPTKYYSITVDTSSASTTATSTAYYYAGDLLLAEVFQSLIDGVATGTPTTHYVHPDHLGSVNVLSDASGNTVSVHEYYPYGATLTSTTTSDLDSTRGYIGLYTDPTDLVYANARYYDAGRGQFTTQDPVFWSNTQILPEPQSLNSYSYGNDNPIRNSDPSGRSVYAVAKAIEANSFGTHIFLVLQPDNVSDFANSGIPMQEGGYWTVGGYASDNGSTLVKGINALSDLTAYQAGYSIPSTQQGAVKSKQLIATPQGMTDTQFINAIQGGYNAYGDDAQYDPFALSGYNSNSLASGWVVGAGGTLPFKGNAPGIDPGYGRPLPSNYIRSSGSSLVPTTMSGILSRAGSYSGSSALSSILSSLTGALTQLKSALSSVSSTNNKD